MTFFSGENTIKVDTDENNNFILSHPDIFGIVQILRFNRDEAIELADKLSILINITEEREIIPIDEV